MIYLEDTQIPLAAAVAQACNLKKRRVAGRCPGGPTITPEFTIYSAAILPCYLKLTVSSLFNTVGGQLILFFIFIYSDPYMLLTTNDCYVL